MALVQVMMSASSASFGQMAEQYCTQITRVLIVIKEGERHKRGETSSLEVTISSDSTPIPKQWGKYISNP
ncbi:hypothetical protein P5673_010840 [Acropora cervicornis]|uniref:Uncharacterized protein n=1 Tax=Acropora cervicornis TaxID=6130 RepID=A0AAD9QQI1_ACRCE|nr:hypothetical protein P5673_010840 [Acropora cervicornis]